MPKLHLTEHIVKSLCFQEKAEIYRDDELAGLYVYVGQSAKTYMLNRELHKRSLKITIGRTTEMTLIQARRKAAEMCVQIRNGIDPRHAIKRVDITLEKLFEKYIAAKTLKKSTIDSFGYTINIHLKDWKSVGISNISKAMIQERHAKIGANVGLPTANKTMKNLRAVLNYATVFHGIESNNVHCLSAAKTWFRENPRQGVLRQNEYKIWYEAVQQEEPLQRDYIEVLMLTGLRMSEALNLRWTDIDIVSECPVLTVLDTKNGDPLTIPVTQALKIVLERRLLFSQGSAWVFPGSGVSGHLEEPKKIIKRVEQRCGLKINFHDLRRSYATLMESMDLPAYALKRLLNHRTSDITGRYIIRDVERLRQPAEQVAQRIMALVKGEL